MDQAVKRSRTGRCRLLRGDGFAVNRARELRFEVGSLVFVNDAFRGHPVKDRGCVLQFLLTRLGIGGFSDFLDRRLHARAFRHVADPSFLGLSHPFFGGFMLWH